MPVIVQTYFEFIHWSIYGDHEFKAAENDNSPVWDAT